MDALKPFDQAKSDREAPIRVVEDPWGNKHVMNGNHRIGSAAEDGVRGVEGEIYTPKEWKDAFDIDFDASRGTRTPRIR